MFERDGVEELVAGKQIVEMPLGDLIEYAVFDKVVVVNSSKKENR